MLTRPTNLSVRGQSGQALLVAVLLMMAILLVGILFVSIVNFNQMQTERDVDVSGALALAKAGINFVDYQLRYSELGADWRPPFVAWVAGGSPVPPVAVEDVGAGTVTYTPGFFGPDGIAYTDDDYYTEQEILRGYYGIVRVNNPGGISDHYHRFGFVRYPDPNMAGGSASAAELFAHNLAVGHGHVLLRVTYDPDPPYEYNDSSLIPDPMSKHIKIESVGVLDEAATVIRKLTAYKPLPLLDHALWVTDRSNTGRGTKLGFDPWLDMAQDGITWDNTDLRYEQPDFLTLTIYGPVRVNGALNLEGASCDAVIAAKDPAQASVHIGLRQEPLPVQNPMAWFPRGGGYLADDKVMASDQIYEPRTSGDYQEQGTAIVGYYNDSGSVNTTAPLTIWPSYDNPATTPVEAFDTYGGQILDGVAGTDVAGYDRAVGPLAAPDILATDPNTNLDRYRQLTEHSGDVVFNPSTEVAVNTGQFGAGAGIYVDNFADLQFVKADGTRDLDLLMEDWLQHIALDDPRASESAWNATRTLYSPPGVIIELFPSEDAATGYGALSIDSTLNPNDPAVPGSEIDPDEIWWPGHIAGQPGIKLTRLDKRWAIGDPGNPSRVGEDSGLNVMYRDYPTTGYQVIFAEGNVRIKGVMPANTRLPGGALDDDYSLTVVSGGTIYVDGQLLGAQDAEGRRWGTGDTGGGVLDEDAPKLALLARDCVCVNTSQIVPQMTTGTVAAAADDPANPLSPNQHWEVTPDGGGYAYTTWMFGQVPAAPLMLVPYQTGEDPGPAGVAMTLRRYDRGSSSVVATGFDFDQSDSLPGVSVPTFLFVAPGAPLGGGLFAPQPWASQVLSPLWESEYYAPGVWPELPWRLEVPAGDPDYGEVHYLAEMVGGVPVLYPGQSYALELRYSDPNLGVPGTDYWLKKFKLAVLNTATRLPEPAINAKINAVMYAQEGCFFIIPGDYFDTRWSGPMAKHYMRYNYGIEIRGAISENFHARPEAWREWQDKWAIANSAGGWNTISYTYDETLRACRDQARTNVVSENVRQADTAFEPITASGRSNLPKVPLLPVGSDLIYAD